MTARSSGIDRDIMALMIIIIINVLMDSECHIDDDDDVNDYRADHTHDGELSSGANNLFAVRKLSMLFLCC